MSALDRKLLRDLWRLRGQVLAIALVISSGVALLVMSLSAIEALEETAEAYYDRYRFAEVFATVKRAPEPLAERISKIPGVQTVETRIVKLATLDLPRVRRAGDRAVDLYSRRGGGRIEPACDAGRTGRGAGPAGTRWWSASPSPRPTAWAPATVCAP